MTDPGVPFAPFRKNNRESLDKLPSLISKLTEEVKELKISSSKLMENMRYKGGAPFLEGLSVTSSMAPDIRPLLGTSGASCLSCSYLQRAPTRLCAYLSLKDSVPHTKVPIKVNGRRLEVLICFLKVLYCVV